MPQPLPSLLSLMERDALVVTPTALSAGSLRAEYDRVQRAAGSTVWRPANVLSWRQWLGSLWSGLVLDGHEARLLLNNAQEELLWRDIVASQLDAANMSAASGFAQLAQSAYALAAGYTVTGRLAAEARTEDTEQFARWADDFTRLCGRHDYLPAARLPAALQEHLARQHFTAPAELHLLAPLDLAPADADLLAALRLAGTQIHQRTMPVAAPVSRAICRAANETEELRAVAHWLRDFLLSAVPSSTSTDPPTVNVALAGPRMDFSLLNSVFREVIAPELNLITADDSFAPWRLVAGEPLAGLPVAAALLRLLRGLTRPLSVDEVTTLLLSPYLGKNHDRDTAAQLDAWTLRSRPPLRPELTYQELQRLAERSSFGENTLLWLRPLARVEQAAELSAPRTYAAWATWIRELAASVGWPGEQPLDAVESAAAQAWEHLLDSIATLDFTGRRVAFTDAYAALVRQAEATRVTLPSSAPIRILTAEEAAFLPCEALVLLQATDTNWPPTARPHPLLPWHLQAAAGMPGAHPACDAAGAERLTAALLTAPHVLVTYAAESNEAPQRLAPMFSDLTEELSSPPWRELSASLLIPEAGPAIIPEQVVDDVPLPPLPSPQVSGGATVLQLQAACGFRAFAELRLRSTEPGTTQLGFDARRAGNLLHIALDTFWQRVPSQKELRNLSEITLDEHLEVAVQEAFSSVRVSEDSWDRAYRALQMQRLYELLKSWLNFETKRSPFTIFAREQDRRLEVGPLQLQLRVDRIDTVGSSVPGHDDGLVLIDYKTGYEAHPGAWESERPDQPQLPLYTLLPHAAELRALAFARVRRGQFTWAGIQAEPGLLPSTKLNANLEDLVAEWRRVLTRLAEQFAAGDHAVNPKSYPNTCTYCGQRFLCRLDPHAQLASTLDEEDPVLEEQASHG